MNQHTRLPMPEFIALLAMLFAMTAFSIDAMLPAMPQIVDELTPDAPNRAQFIITSFVFGMGLGTFATGPLSDAFGRRRIIIGGVFLYCFGAALAWVAPTLELLLAARVLQGIGVAGPRVASMALVRDLYSGRQMARIISFAMMIFVLVPAAAPLVGAVIIAGFGWRSIFASFLLFAAVSTTWFWLRQGETLPIRARRPLKLGSFADAVKEVLTNRPVVMVIMALTLIFACLFSTLSSTQMVFDQRFGRGESFPVWFALVALVSGLGSLANARLVMKFGMRAIVVTVLTAQAVNSAVMALLFAMNWVPEVIAFWLYLYWIATIFSMISLTIGNLNAIAMEPMGHIAGMAASLVTAIATVLSVGVAAPIAYAFDGTPVPMMIGIFACVTLALPLVLKMPR